MGMRFTKMHGAGNDYVYVDGFQVDVADPPALARRISDRHFGVGADGLIIIRPPRDPGHDCRMEMYNADGSRGEMCGNGIRCVAKFVHDHGIAPRPEIAVETDTGVKTVLVERDAAGRAETLTVDMGRPGLRRSDVPILDGGPPQEPAVGVPLELDGFTFRLTGLSMGNPHAVIRLDQVEAPPGRRVPALEELPLLEWGPRFEWHPWFPERTNTEFIVLRSRREIDFRVWERGSGETLACGTGACAAVVASVVNDWCDRDVLVHLRGGDLRIRWDSDRDGGRVWMSGGATEVFHGELIEDAPARSPAPPRR